MKAMFMVAEKPSLAQAIARILSRGNMSSHMGTFSGQPIHFKMTSVCVHVMTLNFLGIAGAFQRGYHRYYNKYISVKKGSLAGLNMVLAAYVLFSYCLSYKELKHERHRNYH